MSQELSRTLTLTLEHLLAEKEMLADEVRMEINAYWEWFKARNKEISQLRKTGQSKSDTSSIAPVIEKKVSKASGSYKYYVVWKQHSRKFREKISSNTNVKGPSLPLHSYKLTSATHILINKTSWDRDEAIELESKLERYRIALNTIQQAEMKIRVGIRQLSKIM
tara:strand:+ start:14194 stop:14688 length:495 start_codon:yes stop_codon:yes gene_type:complete